MVKVDLDKFRTDAEIAIRVLETKFETLDTVCAAAADTIIHLNEHSISLETTLNELRDTTEDIGKAYDTLEEMVVDLKKNMLELERRFEALDNKEIDDLDKISWSDILICSGLVVGVIAGIIGGFMN